MEPINPDDLLVPMRGENWSALLVKAYPELAEMCQFGDEMRDMSDMSTRESRNSSWAAFGIGALFIANVLMIIGFGAYFILSALMH